MPQPLKTNLLFIIFSLCMTRYSLSLVLPKLQRISLSVEFFCQKKKSAHTNYEKEYKNQLRENGTGDHNGVQSIFSNVLVFYRILTCYRWLQTVNLLIFYRFKKQKNYNYFFFYLHSS